MKRIYTKIDSVLSKFSCLQINLVSLVIIVLISLLDLVVGHEIAVSIFFLLPIALSTWYCSERAGIFFCFLSAMVWFLIDYFGHVYVNPFAPYWNGLVRLGIFLITEGLLYQLRIYLGMEKKLSRTDSLTGLLNVRGFTEQVEKLFSLAARHRRPVVLAYIDLDNFKMVNDRFGHSEGDRVLQVVSGKFLTSLRVTDVVGRLGGDEFAIVLPETEEAGAKARFDTLRVELLREMQQHNWPIGLSIGVVSFDSPPSNLDEAIRIADALMYQVKTSGKNNIAFEHYPQR